MAAGNTLAKFFPADNEPPSSNPATPDIRNQRPCLDFDATTQEVAVFSDIMPSQYAGGSITVYVHADLTSATTGTLGWDVALEKSTRPQDIDSDGFASAKTVTAGTVPGTSGSEMVTSVTFLSSEIDGVVAGDLYRVKIRRDVANDTAAGDGELLGVELREA